MNPIPQRPPSARLSHERVGERVDGRSERRRDVGGGIVVVVVADRDEARAAADGEDVAVRSARHAEHVGGGGDERRRVGAALRGLERRLGELELGAEPLDLGRRGVVLLLRLERRPLRDEPVGEQQRRGPRPRPRAASARTLQLARALLRGAERARRGTRPCSCASSSAIAIRSSVKTTSALDAAAEHRGQPQHVVDVPLRVVVGEDRAGDVGAALGRREVARGRVDAVVGVPRVGDAVAVRRPCPSAATCRA